MMIVKTQEDEKMVDMIPALTPDLKAKKKQAVMAN